MPRLGINDIVKRETPLVCLTAYTAQIARLLDPHVDLLLVGDSVGMVLYGAPTTLSVTLEIMIAHGRAVVDATEKALVVVDMPYGSYETSPAEALKNARRVLDETKGSAVKLEGGREMAATIAHLIANSIPVMAHIGLLPQSVEKTGGYKIQGRGADAGRLIADAKAIEQAGAFAVVIEGTIENVARSITETIAIPTIGIGASVACDGQILVINDVLGLTPKPPRFARRFVDLAPMISTAVKSYADDVRARRFPASDNVVGES